MDSVHQPRDPARSEPNREEASDEAEDRLRQDNESVPHGAAPESGRLGRRWGISSVAMAN